MKDPLSVGLGALGSGAGTGGATIVAALILVRTLERHFPGINYEESAQDPVLVGTFAGLAVGAAFGWRKSGALDNIAQRGVIGLLSAVGALLIAFIAWPVHRLLGIPGLIGLGLASFALGVAASRWAAQGSRPDAVDTHESERIPRA
ncbi:MAG TPA: hypothetical protein VLV16_05280 [Gemmatimonadales bacterium]|nr:hypothetical protein [Gemmatimonadales bacterium]